MKLKKTCLCLGLLSASVIGLTMFSAKSSQAAEIRNINLQDYIAEEKINISNNKLTIIGNDTSISAKDFLSIVENGNDKIYVNYRTNYSVDIPYDMYIVLKVNGHINSYDYTLKNSDIKLVNSIKDYLTVNSELLKNEYIEYLYENNVSTYSTVDDTFVDCGATAEYVFDFAPHSYITSRMALKEYKATDVSSLYILTVVSTFVPGRVAYENGNKNYNKWKNYSGYVHIDIEQAFDNNEEYYYGTRYGAIPYLKDYWPKNNVDEVQISSSYSHEFEIGVSDNDGLIVEGKYNYKYEHSKTIITTNPYVNVQLGTDSKTAQWLYTYDDNINRTYDQVSSYMYEVGETNNNLLYGDVRAKIDYEFTVDRDGFYKKQTDDDSIDLVLRPRKTSGLKIYKFNNGMI